MIVALQSEVWDRLFAMLTEHIKNTENGEVLSIEEEAALPDGDPECKADFDAYQALEAAIETHRRKIMEDKLRSELPPRLKRALGPNTLTAKRFDPNKR